MPIKSSVKCCDLKNWIFYDYFWFLKTCCRHHSPIYRILLECQIGITFIRDISMLSFWYNGILLEKNWFCFLKISSTVLNLFYQCYFKIKSMKSIDDRAQFRHLKLPCKKPIMSFGDEKNSCSWSIIDTFSHALKKWTTLKYGW